MRSVSDRKITRRIAVAVIADRTAHEVGYTGN